MQIDSESKRILRIEILKLQNALVAALPKGNYYDERGAFRADMFEFNRGRIQGMDDVLDLLQPQTETLSGGQNDEPYAA